MIALALACGNTYAARFAVSSGNDERIKQVVYAEDDVVNVQLAVGYFTRIILNPDEQVVAIHEGKGEGYIVTTTPSGVTIEPQSRQEGDEWIDPDEQWATNLEIETDKRLYMLALAITVTPDFRIKMLYPDEVEAARVAEIEVQAAAEIKAQPKPKQCTEFSYELYPGDHSNGILPKTVCDDGKHTFIEFLPNSEMPTVALGLGEDETITDFDVEKDRPKTIRVKTIAPMMTLRLNKGKTKMVVAIKNLAHPGNSQ